MYDFPEGTSADLKPGNNLVASSADTEGRIMQSPPLCKGRGGGIEIEYHIVVYKSTVLYSDSGVRGGRVRKSVSFLSLNP